MVAIVPELPIHLPAREALLDQSFGPNRRAKTCERLREGRLPANDMAFAMLDQGRLVATLRLWHVSAGPGCPALMLGPLAVAADRRGEGLGCAMMRHALGAAGEAGHGAVLLVGDAPYYERFGFSVEHTGRLWLPGPYERERFLGHELAAGALAGAAGLVNPTGDAMPAELAWPMAA